MAKLINGDGNKAIWAQQDADLIASLAGNVTAIADVGSKFAATQEDANTIGLADGVIVTKEGRRIQLDVGNVDLFDIPTGTAGVTSYYIIGYHLYTESDSSQVCETFVQKMDNATDVITENTFRGGATEVYVSCYRVTQTGMNITSIDALLQNFKSLSEVMSALTDLGTLTTLNNDTTKSFSTSGTNIQLSESINNFKSITVLYRGTSSAPNIAIFNIPVNILKFGHSFIMRYWFESSVDYGDKISYVDDTHINLKTFIGTHYLTGIYGIK